MEFREIKVNVKSIKLKVTQVQVKEIKAKV